VAGAVVTFAVRGGRATVAGGRSLTLTTNVAGRAAAAGLTPTTSGALQISASAAFQGQTAVATIVQTNVMTAISGGDDNSATHFSGPFSGSSTSNLLNARAGRVRERQRARSSSQGVLTSARGEWSTMINVRSWISPTSAP
jgi:hypothetical protein